MFKEMSLDAFLHSGINREYGQAENSSDSIME